MGAFATFLVGPLAGPECRRARARGWGLLVRVVAALPAAVVAFVVAFAWHVTLLVEPGYQPFELLRGGIVAIENVLLTVALLLSPALLAGSLVSDRQRGILGLLLTTRVSAREIVLGRLAGKLSQIGMILLAGLPCLVFLAALAGFAPVPTAVALALPVAIALGAGGIAMLASIVSRRGLAALVTVYLLVGLLLMAPLLSRLTIPPWAAGVLWDLDPYTAIGPLAWEDATGPALRTMGLWLALGLGGLAFAIARLRPVFLRTTGGPAQRIVRARRRRPPVSDERPMLWKALHVEGVASLGWFGRLLGVLLLLWLAGLTTVAVAAYGWSIWIDRSVFWDTWANGVLRDWVAAGAPVASLLIQWALGVQAAVAIASERERATWDALLCSPLEGRDIVLGKLWGSLYALRWLIASALWAWTWSLALGAMPADEYATLLVSLASAGLLMAAAGIRVSLAVTSITKAVAITVAIWLAAFLGLGLVSLAMVLALWLLYLMIMAAGYAVGWVAWSSRMVVPPVSFGPVYLTVDTLLYALAAVLLIADLRLRFDRLAGRIPGEALAIKFDRALRGAPVASADGKPPAKEPAEAAGREIVLLEQDAG